MEYLVIQQQRGDLVVRKREGDRGQGTGDRGQGTGEERRGRTIVGLLSYGPVVLTIGL